MKCILTPELIFLSSKFHHLPKHFVNEQKCNKEGTKRELIIIDAIQVLRIDKLNDINDLLQRISEEINSLRQSSNVIRRSVRSMEIRCRRCVERDGGHVEH